MKFTKSIITKFWNSKIYTTVLLLFAFSCNNTQLPPSGWKKVFQNDENGEVISGDKSELINAVRRGYPVRIGWGGNRVEHVANADFITILEGEVFAQIESIVGQSPDISGDSIKIRFRPQNQWTNISGTNGYSTGLMTNVAKDTIVGGGMDRSRASTWYVFYPANMEEIDARPLWRSTSPKWQSWKKTY